jgi:hypothetical protein
MAKFVTMLELSVLYTVTQALMTVLIKLSAQPTPKLLLWTCPNEDDEEELEEEL